MISVENLSCRRGSRQVFHDVGFVVKAGGLMLVTGPNGSGKSSLLRVLAGLLASSSGTMFWDHKEINPHDVSHRARLHYVGHLNAIKSTFTIREMLEYWQSLRKSGPVSLLDLNAFALGPLIDHNIRHLSAGQKRRLSLMRLMIGDAPVWLLDEPTSGLDREGQDLLRFHFERHRASGGIVIAASHDDLRIPDATHLSLRGSA